MFAVLLRASIGQIGFLARSRLVGLVKGGTPLRGSVGHGDGPRSGCNLLARGAIVFRQTGTGDRAVMPLRRTMFSLVSPNSVWDWARYPGREEYSRRRPVRGVGPNRVAAGIKALLAW